MCLLLGWAIYSFCCVQRIKLVTRDEIFRCWGSRPGRDEDVFLDTRFQFADSRCHDESAQTRWISRLIKGHCRPLELFADSGTRKLWIKASSPLFADSLATCSGTFWTRWFDLPFRTLWLVYLVSSNHHCGHDLMDAKVPVWVGTDLWTSPFSAYCLSCAALQICWFYLCLDLHLLILSVSWSLLLILSVSWSKLDNGRFCSPNTDKNYTIKDRDEKSNRYDLLHHLYLFVQLDICMCAIFLPRPPLDNFGCPWTWMWVQSVRYPL